MQFKIDDEIYEVIMIRKNNMKIYVTTSRFVTKHQIESILNENKNYIYKNLNKMNNKVSKKDKFYYLGNEYNIIYDEYSKKVEILNNNIVVKDDKMLNNWLNDEIKRIFKARLYYYYQAYEEDIPYPKVKFRKMKTRWGVCNKRDISITLNTELIKYNIEGINYVIVHELSHFIHFNHSRAFWNLVSKYYPNYKNIRKMLKD